MADPPLPKGARYVDDDNPPLPPGATYAGDPPLPPGATYGDGPPPDDRNGLQRAFDNLTTVTPEQEQGHSWLTNKAQEFGAGAIAGAGAPLVHPLQTAEGLGHAIAHPIDTVEGMAKGLWDNPANTLGNIAGGAVYGAAGKALEAAPMVNELGSAVRSAAIGDPDLAALRGLKITSNSPKGLSTLESVRGARPYLKGATSLQDLQARIPAAKAEVWAPYQQAVEGIGARPVRGPDGMTTVRELEADRAQTSALLRGLKSKNPEAVQLAQQKGLTEAALLQKEKAIRGVLDPHLESVGIKPREIRRTFGDVARVGNNVSGKTTLTEPLRPYGFGKMMDMRLDNPRTLIGSPVQGARDILAGRPWWRGKPTDINIREAFRSAGEKPSLGSFVPPQVKGLLQSPMVDIPLGDVPGPGEMPGALVPAQRFPPQNVGEARVIRNAKGQMLPKALRKMEFPDAEGKLPFGRDPKGRILSRKPTAKAWMTSPEREIESAPPVSGPGILRRRTP